MLDQLLATAGVCSSGTVLVSSHEGNVAMRFASCLGHFTGLIAVVYCTNGTIDSPSSRQSSPGSIPTCLRQGEQIVQGRFCCSGASPVWFEGWGWYCVNNPPSTTAATTRITTALTTVPLDTTSASPLSTTTTEAPSTTASTTSSTEETASPATEPDDGCDGIGNVVRKNVDSMSSREWADYLEALTTLRNTASTTYPGLSVFDEFSRIHQEHAEHSNNNFLAWHRLMLWKWDTALGSAKQGVVQPYFDWSVSADDVFANPKFSEGWFGGGSAGQGGSQGFPIPNGPWQGIESAWPSRHAVSRSFNNDPLATSDLIDSFVEQVFNFERFRTVMEYEVHNAFHRAIGGDMMTSWSPNEPLFYFHHAFIDMNYRRWQRRGVDGPSTPELLQRMNPWDDTMSRTLQGPASRCVSYEGISSGISRYYMARQPEKRQKSYKFESVSEKVEALLSIARTKICDPTGYKKGSDRWRRAGAAVGDAAIVLGRDLSQLATGRHVTETLLLKSGTVDISEVERICHESEVQIKMSGERDLEVLKKGALPQGTSTADVEKSK